MTVVADLLYSPAAVRAMDSFAIDVLGIDSYRLMQRAGRAAYDALKARWPSVRELRIVCGIGNNAGDGFVVGRLALEEGWAVSVLQLGDAGRLQGAARQAADAYYGAGGATEPFQPQRLGGAGLVVDAVFGTGLDRVVQGEWARALAAINAADAPVMALDIPSGLHGGTGSVLGVAVRADLTVSFIARKIGLFTGAGPACVGEVILDRLGLPAEVYQQRPAGARLTDDAEVAACLPPRPRDAHKGHFGHVLVIGGDYGFGGAARMAGESAARMGAGLITVATRPEHVGGLLAARPELMARGVERAAELSPLLARATVIVIGPGLGQGAWGRALFEQALQFDGPLVVDADGLNLLAQSPRRRDNWVLTPHPGEAARLLGSAPAAIPDDRLAAAEQLATRYGGVIVLKGAGTVVWSDGPILPAIGATGNPGMASGGMGDVLTGMIAGLLAQGLPASTAAAVAVHLHGMAADRAVAAAGERGLLALDLLPELRRLVNPR